jgi:hypothetical protein
MDIDDDNNTTYPNSSSPNIPAISRTTDSGISEIAEDLFSQMQQSKQLVEGTGESKGRLRNTKNKPKSSIARQKSTKESGSTSDIVALLPISLLLNC